MREDRFWLLLLLTFLLLSLLSLLYLERDIFLKKKFTEKKEVKTYLETKTPPLEIKKEPKKEGEKEKITPVLKKTKKPRFKLAIVIDDVGTSPEQVYMLEKLPREITPSVLPFRKYSLWSSVKLRSAGFEILLHIPMEPINNNFTEEKMLTVKMNRKEIETFLNEALKEVPKPAGINNHEGSLFSSQRKPMLTFLSLVKKQGFFFLDSRTTARSLGYTLARSMKIKTCKRDIFLDNDHSLSYMKEQWRIFLEKAEKQGKAIAIGHAKKETLKNLSLLIKNLPKKFQLVRVSTLAE